MLLLVQYGMISLKKKKKNLPGIDVWEGERVLKDKGRKNEREKIENERFNRGKRAQTEIET